MEISARNVLKGKVKRVTPGAVNSEIIVEVAGGVEVVSIITKSSSPISIFDIPTRIAT